jgi:hypothetical protein
MLITRDLHQNKILADRMLVQTMENSHSSLVSSKIWESIDDSIKQSITVNIFKKRYKNFLLSIMQRVVDLKALRGLTLATLTTVHI